LTISISDFPCRTQWELLNMMGMRPIQIAFLTTICFPLVYSTSTFWTRKEEEEKKGRGGDSTRECEREPENEGQTIGAE